MYEEALKLITKKDLQRAIAHGKKHNTTIKSCTPIHTNMIAIYFNNMLLAPMTFFRRKK